MVGRSRPNDSSMSRTERARPTFTGTTAVGKSTELRSGRIGRSSGPSGGGMDGLVTPILYHAAVGAVPRSPAEKPGRTGDSRRPGRCSFRGWHLADTLIETGPPRPDVGHLLTSSYLFTEVMLP